MGKRANFKVDIYDAHIASCFLRVSFGQPYYQGGSLAAVLTLIKNTKFGSHRYVMFADTLNAYNLLMQDSFKNNALHGNLAEARKLAEQKGTEWLNSSDGQMLQDATLWTRPVIRWSAILSHPHFAVAKQRIDALFVAGPDRKKLVSVVKDETANPQEREGAKLQLAFSSAVDRLLLLILRELGRKLASSKLFLM